ADELERALEGTADELLSLKRAAAESGYTVDHIGRILRHQPTLNKGRKHAPRIRRGDLPKKRTASGTGLASAAAETHFDDRLFRSIAYSKFGG
ncbi:MAG: hypothetical protein M3418_02695, partial [Gemmatimonadota bacterium]|nr:hypothetical protein [Gemmatimonadota bacterium]